MADRHRFSVTSKLHVMVRQAVCPLCSEKLGLLQDTEFDHVVPLAMGGADDVTNLQAVHRDCHAAKTRGTGATTAGSDIGRIAKTKRLTRREQEFRERLLAKNTAFLPADHHDRGAREAKRKIPSRPFPKRPSND